MNGDELMFMFNKYRKYVEGWADKAICGEKVLSFDEWRKKVSDGKNSFIEMVEDLEKSFVSYQFDVTGLARGMNYIDEDYKSAYLVMKVEFCGRWTVSSKVCFDLCVENYHASSWKYDMRTKEVETKEAGKDGKDENDFLEFLMNPEVCRLFIGKTGVVCLT